MRNATSRSSQGAWATCTAKVVDEPAKALPYYERALSLVEPIAADEPRRRRAAAWQGVRAGFDRRPAKRPASATRRSRELPARARHHRTFARSRSRTISWHRRRSAFMLNGRGSSHLLLGDAAAALHDFSRAETIVRNAPPPQPTDIAEIRMLPGVTYANLARATAGDVAAVLDAEAPASQLRARSSRLVASCARGSAAARGGRARRPAREARHRRDDCSHCCASSRVPKIRIWIRGLSLSIWNIRAKPN